MTLHASAVSVLESWEPPTTDQDSVRHALMSFLAARPDGCLRSCEPGHITASAVVLDATREHVLLTLHPRVGKWLQLGGHCEPADASLVDAALREASEESGLEGLSISSAPVHLAVHPITCSLGRPTRHLDVRFVVTAPSGASPVRSDESLDLRRWPVDALPAESTDLRPLVSAALAA